MVRILPSIASADQLAILEEMKRIEGTPYLHIDVEDGNFLPNITFGMKTVQAIVKQNAFSYDVHLLCNEPMKYIEELKDDSIKEIAFHIESSMYPLQELNRIHKYGKKAGLAFNFKTPIQEAIPFLDAIDYIIIMTSEPDDEGNAFISSILDKIKEARRLLPSEISIWVDGGISEKELPKVVEAGADCVVMGRAVFKNENPKKAIKKYSGEVVC